jgi:hypothetical protein
VRAIRAIGPGRVEIANVPQPADTGETLVRMRQVGICGSDVKMLAGKVPIAYPRILGHEGVGEVVSAPADAPIAVGSRVLVDPARACGWCHLCIAGRANLCRNGGLMGRDFDGVFTEIIAVPSSGLLSVPDDISSRASGLLQVLGTCVHAVGRLRLFPGQVAAVIGLGVAGLRRPIEGHRRLRRYERRATGMARLYGGGVDRLLYRPTLRGAFGPRVATVAYVVLGFFATALYGKTRPETRSGTFLAWVTFGVFRIWTGSWVALSRVTGFLLRKPRYGALSES